MAIIVWFLITAFVAAILQWFWSFSGMGVWTHIGPMPFWCAFFITAVFVRFK